MKGQVSAGWLNALVITVTLLMWLSIVASVVVGIAVADAAGVVVDDSNNGCVYDPSLGMYYDSRDEHCTP